jgi:hypothetical protein
MPKLQGNLPMTLIAAATVGAVSRSIHVTTANFPLHDGGLLFSMAHDVLSNRFALPSVTSYNRGDIPFAYPPLSLYLAAALNAVGVPLLGVLQWLPLALSIASIPLVYLVIRRLLSPAHGVAAAFAFALMPSAFNWLIVGGGLTRALGLVLALISIHEALLVVEGQPRWRGVAAGVAGGLTVLAHPYAAAFAVLSIAVILAWRARTRSAWIASLVAVGCSVVVVLPWVVAVVSMHGWGPLLAGGSSRTQVGVSVASLLFEDVTGATFSVFLGIGLIGFVVELARGRFFIPLWLVLTLVFLVGGGWIMPMLPMAALIGVAIVDVVIPGLAHLGVGRQGTVRAMAGLLTAGLVASLGVGYVILTPLYPLSVDQRTAMSWIKDNTPNNATFAVVTGQPWALDTASEWFPALTERISVGTAQGYEWTPSWDARVSEAVDLQACVSDGRVECLTSWTVESGRTPNFIYVAKGPQLGPLSPQDCCSALREALAAVDKPLYDGPGATIFRWSGSGSPPAGATPTEISVVSYTNRRGSASTAVVAAASTE